MTNQELIERLNGLVGLFVVSSCAVTYPDGHQEQEFGGAGILERVYEQNGIVMFGSDWGMDWAITPVDLVLEVYPDEETYKRLNPTGKEKAERPEKDEVWKLVIEITEETEADLRRIAAKLAVARQGGKVSAAEAALEVLEMGVSDWLDASDPDLAR